MFDRSKRKQRVECSTFLGAGGVHGRMATEDKVRVSSPRCKKGGRLDRMDGGLNTCGAAHGGECGGARHVVWRKGLKLGSGTR